MTSYAIARSKKIVGIIGEICMYILRPENGPVKISDKYQIFIFCNNLNAYKKPFLCLNNKQKGNWSRYFYASF